ncbi:MAG: O-antigen ligase family protein [Aulosira sp. DedQUE10]|nr:O-antigen ligase family protein [Aulosira sp. DedQUE10]
MKILLSCIIVIAVFGQPNGFALLVPSYPFLASALTLFFLVFIFFNKLYKGESLFTSLNIYLPTIIFLGYSLLSLAYAPDPLFGFRIWISMIFKLIVFTQIVIICNQKNSIKQRLKQLLKTVAIMGTAFSIQGLLLILLTALFNLNPISEINEVGGLGLIDYEYNLFSYGILGFGKQYITFLSFTIPRCQAMFTEPGWFANFLELSFFSTLGYSALEKNHQSIRWMLWLQILALFCSFSTVGWLAVFIGYLTYIICVNTDTKALLTKIVKIGFLLILITTVLIAIISFFPSILEEIYNIIWLEKFATAWGTASATERMEIINSAQDLFVQRPLLGWGTNQMRIVSDGFGANNAVITVAVELGFIGIIIYFIMILAVIKTIFTNYRMALIYQSNSLIHLTASSSGCVIALITHSMFVDTNWAFFYWIGLSFVYINYLLLNHYFKSTSFY